MQAIHSNIIIMEQVEQVEIEELLSVTTIFRFEGEPQIEQVKFNNANTLKFYQFASTIGVKSASVSPALLGLFPQLLQLSKCESVKRSVCAKIVSQGETIVQCINCRMDESCIICLDCYKNGSHAGHKILYKKAYGGCCDCGDSEAWDPKGFCSNHSGEVQDVKIEAQTITKFTSIMQDLFYLYYRIKLRRENQMQENTFLLALLQTLDKIIAEGPKGIKLIALFLQGSIPSHLKFNEALQDQSILSHILTWNFIGQDLRFWENIFIKMFPYYEFKKQLLSAYIQCFPILYVNQASFMLGQSLACQILTSYKLIQDYIDNPQSQPLGYNITHIKDPQRIDGLLSMLYTDLEKITKLQDPVPQKYMKLQASKGISPIFFFQSLLNKRMQKSKEDVGKINESGISKKEIKKKKKKMENENLKSFFNPIRYMIENIKQSYNEYSSLQVFNSLLRTIKHDKTSLLKILKECAELIDNDSEDLVIFRVYDRAFCLTLFALSHESLENLLEAELRNQIMQALQKNEDEFEDWLRKIEERMLKTYFFYAHILCNQNRGYHSSFFNYIYLYRTKDHFLSSIDTIQLKMIALLSRNQPTLNITKLLRFEDFDEEKWSLFILNTFFQDLQLIYVGNFSEIYISHYDILDKPTSQLRQDVIQYFAKFIVGQGNSVSLERATKFSKSFLFDNPDLVKKYLCECCTYNRDRKIFQLKEKYRNQKPLNYQDFELRMKDDKFSNKNIEQSRPELSRDLIKGYNINVFSHYWNEANTESIKQIFINLYEEAVESKVQDQMVEVAIIMCKICSNLRFLGTQEQLLIADQLLLRAPIAPEIRHKLIQYQEILGNEDIQPEKQLQEKKDLLRSKKMKKMDEIRKKNEENMLAIREVHQIEEEHHVSQEYCAICRKKDSPKHQIVYLAHLTIRNLEKLSNSGPGVQTASFTTCYHIFDFQCLEKESKNNYEAIFKCPICRKVGNLYLPAYPLWDEEKSQPYVKAFIERVTQVMMTIHNYQEIDPLEQLFKGFYHFSLMSQFDEEYVRKHRLRLYRTLYEIFFHSSVQSQLHALASKFLRNEINLNPKLLKPEKVRILSMKNDDDYEIDSQSDDDEEPFQNFLILTAPSRYPIKKSSSSKEKLIKKNSSFKEKPPKKIQMSAILTYVGLRIFRQLFEHIQKVNKSKQMVSEQAIIHEKTQLVDENGSKKQSQMEPQTNSIEQNLKKGILPEVPFEIVLIIDELFGASAKMKSNQNGPRRLQFIELPNIFHWDMSQNICDLCKQTSYDIFICLLCGWKGCLNCKSGGVNKHFPLTHGETSAFMRLNDAIVYLIGAKIIKKIGCLYLNEWGEQLKLKKDWSSYSLQYSVLQKTRNMLLRDE